MKKDCKAMLLLALVDFQERLFLFFFDLYAFVIANLIQTYIAFDGYRNNKKIGETP